MMDYYRVLITTISFIEFLCALKYLLIINPVLTGYKGSK